MRGQPARASRLARNTRIIPARAGPTWARIHWPPREPDHPRSCGANTDCGSHIACYDGSSPLVRGQLVSMTLMRRRLRIIPARAGPTRKSSVRNNITPDHPRSCGANSPYSSPRLEHAGSSPLVRGQPLVVDNGIFSKRIIPARAGPTHARQH